MDRNKMIFFNTAYMKKYQGDWENDVPVNGGPTSAIDGLGEVFNFKPYDGMMYGFVEPGRVKKGDQPRKINISRLIISRPGGRKTISPISEVLIIWVARPPDKDESVMVGWYENATLYRKRKPFVEDKERILPNNIPYLYFASAKESDCQLLPVEERTLPIPRVGRSNIWYAESRLGEQTKDKVISFINKRKGY